MMFTKKCLSVFLSVLLVILPVACTAEQLEKAQKVVDYMGMIASCYNFFSNTFYPTLSPEKLAAVCEVHSKVKIGWNLVVTALQSFFENATQENLNEVKVKLASFTTLLQEVKALLNLSPEVSATIDAAIASGIFLVQTVLPKVKITQGEAYDLSALKLTYECGTPTEPTVMVDKKELAKNALLEALAKMDDKAPAEVLKLKTIIK